MKAPPTLFATIILALFGIFLVWLLLNTLLSG